MVNVYDVKVRFMRRMQVREYEPAESEITLSAQLSENDDYKSVTQKLILDARDLVKSGLMGKAAGKTETEVTKTKTPAVDNSASEIPGDEIPDDEIPSDDGPTPAELKKAAAAEKRKIAAEKRKVVAAAKKAKKEAEKQAANNDIPSDDNDDIPSGDSDETISEGDLLEYINSMVTSRKVKPKQIKAIISEYGAARISEIPKENRNDVKDAIDLLS